MCWTAWQQDDNNEQLLEKSENMKEIRAAAAKHPTLGESIIDLVAGLKVCLTQVLSRLLKLFIYYCFVVSMPRVCKRPVLAA